LVEGGAFEMSEAEQQRETSPLLSERGVTTISDTVVSQLAGMAAREVEGVHMGGGVSRTASGVLGSITGSESKTSGISVEVGRTETAIDLKMGVEYNRNILQTVDEVRRRITDRVESITGLRIKELNATITDITFPEKEQRLLIGSGTSTREDSTESTAADTTATESEPEVQTTQESEPAPDVSETTQVETTQVETTDSTADEPEEASTVEEGPPEESETTEVRTEEQPADETPEASEEAQETTAKTETTQEVRAETPEEPEARPESETPEEPETGPETPEPDTPEARMRRRAEERARRRRRRSQES
jgi:uncharacterized alkaline shock family protein YloU